MKLVNIITDIIREGSVKSEERVKLYEDDRLLVVVPLSHKASCKYGAHTPWCVATPSNTEHYQYYRNNGVFIYFIIKSPYPNAKIKEYKFAYYHSFTDEMSAEGGWYDMSDYHYGPAEPESDIPVPDMKLIKFLIPNEIFTLAKQYLIKQKPIFKQEQLKRLQQGYETMINDPDNQVIVNDDNWFIFYRIQQHKPYFEFYYTWSRQPNLSLEFYLTYINKRNFQGVEQKIPYNYDIRGVIDQYNDNKQLHMFYKIGTMDEIDFESVFITFYKPISEAYFEARKINFTPDENTAVYLPPQFVTTKDTHQLSREQHQIINKYECKSHSSKICFDTTRSTNVYYSDVIGVPVRYDANRHNDPNL